MRAALAVGCIAILLLGGGATGALVYFRASDRSGTPFTAEPAVHAFAAPRLSVVETVTSSIVPTCSRHRGGSAPSPALGTPIVSWPETVGVSAECMFESSPGSGDASGGGFDVYGDTSIPEGLWAEYGPSGSHLDACGLPGREDCTDYSYSTVDPRYVLVESWRRFPTGDGWAHVQVVMRR